MSKQNDASGTLWGVSAISSGLAVLLLLATVGFGGSRSLASEPRQRVVTSSYLTPVLGGSVSTGGGGLTAYSWDCTKKVGCVTFDVKKKDRYVSLQIEDAAGQSALGYIELMPGGYHLGTFCGKTEDPIFVRHASEILVHVIAGTCPAGTPSIVTTGVVEATFTQDPLRR